MKFVLKTALIFSLFFIFAPIAQAKPPTAKIIDGSPVSDTTYPFVARLQVDGDLLCTGTLVGPRHVLTAGHCFYDNRNRRAVGDTDITARLNGQNYTSAKVYIHPSFVPRSTACIEGETDAAVIELSSDVAGVPIISILDNPVSIGTSLLLAGYGTQGNGSEGQDGSIPPVGTINVGPTIVEGYGDNPPRQNTSSSYFYWTFDNGEANTASGDSGGPAFFQTGSENYLAGITCGGDGNAEFGTLSFNTRTDLIKSWVLSITGSTPSNSAPGFSKLAAQAVSLGQSFSYTISPSGTQPILLTATGLPAGLTLSGGTISGIPTETGTFAVKIQANSEFGSASTTLKIIVSGFQPALSMQKVLLQFDYDQGAEDFLDITGKINVGSKFKPDKKKITIRIGRFTKTFKLRSNGQSTGNGISYFDLEGKLNNGAFTKSSLKFFLTLERVPLFDELSTLGFPSSANASEGQKISLPLSVTINGIESSTTSIITFQSRDSRWRIVKE